VHIAEALRAQAELSARAEIEAAHAAYQRSLEIVETTMPEMQNRAKEHLAILDDAYRTGGTDLLRYIDARRLSVEVELNALQRLTEYHMSAARLQLAYGEQP
jgi:outer membrane protein TolC